MRMYLIAILCAFALLSVLTPANVETRLRIAVVDTGIDFNNLTLRPFKCLNEHFSVVDNAPFSDNDGHGTQMASLIVKGLNSSRVCLVSVKWYDLTSDMPSALKKLSGLHNISFVNISGGGMLPDLKEKRALEIITQDTTVIVAAGNKFTNLDKYCNFYPACYKLPNLHVARANRPSSNIGKFVNTVPGATSSSEASAMLTNQLIKEYFNE